MLRSQTKEPSRWEHGVQTDNYLITIYRARYPDPSTFLAFFLGPGKHDTQFRDTLKKNAALIWTLSKTGQPPPPQDFWIFMFTFPKVKTFGSFGTLLCILFHPIFWQKKFPKTFGFGQTPPPFLPKI